LKLLPQFACLSLVFLFTTCATPASAVHPIVPSFQRVFAAAESENLEQGGEFLLTELNCVSCHQSDVAAMKPKQAPILNDVSGRVRPDWLEKYLASPQTMKPGATMPDMFVGVSEAEKTKQIESLTHFLYSQGTGVPQQAVANIGARARGERLFHTVGCVACHGGQQEDAVKLPTSVPLGELTAKYTLPSLSSFIQTPHEVRPGGRMPSLNLTSSEARDIAAYLLPNVPEKAGIAYSYYEAKFGDKLPDFSTMTPTETGAVEKIDISPKKRDNDFGLTFVAALQVDVAGEYTFWTKSDDGSRLYVNDKVVVDNDGVHPATEKSGKLKLPPGKHIVRVEFFEKGGGEELTVDIQSPGGKRHPLHEDVVSAKRDEELKPIEFKVNDQLAEQGKKLFTSIGCASCHQMSDETRGKDNVLASTLKSPSLASLDKAKGCLAEDGNGVNYHLADNQKNALALAVVRHSKKSPAKTSEERIDHTLAQFNCYACHARGEKGGIEPERQTFFETTQPEMGMEGAIPPGLDGVGGKLTEAWLRKILAEGAKDRPYMLTRMPKFGVENVGHLVKDLGENDKLDPLPAVELVRKDALNAGRKMVGEKGFACIKCHTFGSFKATGVQSIDMTVMHQRLREDWVRRYLQNPQKFRRGTRMPSAWPPAPNKSLLPDILDGENETQIAAVWLYLKQGKKAKIPLGLYPEGNLLIPASEAIIYRNFIEGVSPRAIAVGYPEELHITFDAQQMTLAQIWQGVFMDAGKHWTGRGQGFQKPGGQNLKTLTKGVSLAILDLEKQGDAPWPEQTAKEAGISFLGYTLTEDQRPTFGYKMGDVEVRDFPNPVETDTTVELSRRIRFTSKSSTKNLYFRVARGEIRDIGDATYEIDGVKISATGLLARESKGQQELLAPVVFTDGKAEIALTYRW